MVEVPLLNKVVFLLTMVVLLTDSLLSERFWQLVALLMVLVMVGGAGFLNQ